MLCWSVQAQETTGKGKISGVVIDDGTKMPVEFATVALVGPDTDKPLDGAVCDDKGKFVITKVPNGSYRLIISFIGYENVVVPNITITDKNHTVDVKQWWWKVKDRLLRRRLTARFIMPRTTKLPRVVMRRMY